MPIDEIKISEEMPGFGERAALILPRRKEEKPKKPSRLPLEAGRIYSEFDSEPDDDAIREEKEKEDVPKQKWSQDANWDGYRSKRLPQGISEALDTIEKGGGDYVSDEIEKYSPNRALMPYDVSNTYVRLLQDYPKEVVDKAFRAAAEKIGDGGELYTQYTETTPIEEKVNVYWPLRKAANYGKNAYRTPANRGEEIDLKLENASRKHGFVPIAIKDRALKTKAEQEKAEKAEILKSLMSEFTDEEIAKIRDGE